MKRTALIMAGGKGERFWPESRISLPKQFLHLTDEKKSMIQLTVERIHPLVEYEDIFISTGEIYRDLVKEHLPQIPEENIICEPEGKNTAPCIGLGAAHIYSRYGGEDTIMIVLPSDHLIKQTDIFIKTLDKACHNACLGDNLVTLGITPTYAETGYGYIRFENDAVKDHDSDIPVYPVREFVEKPDKVTALKYLNDGRYLWNSGMFVWRTSTLRKALETHLPDTFKSLEKIRHSIGDDSYKETLTHEFSEILSESIDYGIMEKSENIFILPGRFGWDDVGSWPAIARVNETDAKGNLTRGNTVLLDCDNCIVKGTDGRLVAILGMKDTIVVDTKDVVLIAQKDKCADIKTLLKTLRENGKDKWL